MEFEKPLYPYRVHVLGGHFHIIFCSERTCQDVWKVIKALQKKDEGYDYVTFTDQRQIIEGIIDSRRIVSVESFLNKSPMIIKNLKGKYEAILYVQKNEKVK